MAGDRFIEELRMRLANVERELAELKAEIAVNSVDPKEPRMSFAHAKKELDKLRAEMAWQAKMKEAT